MNMKNVTSTKGGLLKISLSGICLKKKRKNEGVWEILKYIVFNLIRRGPRLKDRGPSSNILTFLFL